MQNKKLAILISSCDKYSYLWDIQFQFFKKYWPDCPYDIYIISDTKKYEYSTEKLKINTFLSGKLQPSPNDWSANVFNFLSSVDYEYILYLQDDYIFYENVDSNRFKVLLDFVIDRQINYIRFYTAPKGNGESIKISDNISIKKILIGSQWRHSLMTAIWKKNTLRSMLERDLNMNPWNFELNSQICSNYDKFYCIDLEEYDQSDIIKFYGMYGSSGGHTFYPFIIDLINKEGIKKLNGEEIDFKIKL
jgi:hypothetical protein